MPPCYAAGKIFGLGAHLWRHSQLQTLLLKQLARLGGSLFRPWTSSRRSASGMRLGAGLTARLHLHTRGTRAQGQHLGWVPYSVGFSINTLIAAAGPAADAAQGRVPYVSRLSKVM